MSKAKTEYEVLSTRKVSADPSMNMMYAGQIGVFVRLQSGFMAWGFSMDREQAEENAVQNALMVKNG